MINKTRMVLLVAFAITGIGLAWTYATQFTDPISSLQTAAIKNKRASWGHWGTKPNVYAAWTDHSNRLIPIYTFGIDLADFKGENSIYRDQERVNALYQREPYMTVHPDADFMDQTDVYRLQVQAVEQGKKNIILIVFDGMDWETTLAAAIYRNQKVTYDSGRGNGLAFQDYRKEGMKTDFGWFVCSPFTEKPEFDVDAQIVVAGNDRVFGGYSPLIGGFTPWDKPESLHYLASTDPSCLHAVTDSASSATSMTCGIKAFNGAISVDHTGQPVEPLPRQLQKKGFAVGVVTSVPFCHATPACTYANNVNRSDYQDISRDLLGIPSIANRSGLPGMDVVIGCGWGVIRKHPIHLKEDLKEQGLNYFPGNRYLTEEDFAACDIKNGGQYVTAIRTAGKNAKQLLNDATTESIDKQCGLFGFFGTRHGHLPYATANGDFEPSTGRTEHELYSQAELDENPTLADMTEAALRRLSKNETGFWLLVEAGDVDWANHQNNIDCSIGAVFSGEAAFQTVIDWVEKNSNWDETAVILTADHGHLLVIERPEVFATKR